MSLLGLRYKVRDVVGAGRDSANFVILQHSETSPAPVKYLIYVYVQAQRISTVSNEKHEIIGGAQKPRTVIDDRRHSNFKCNVSIFLIHYSSNEVNLITHLGPK